MAIVLGVLYSGLERLIPAKPASGEPPDDMLIVNTVRLFPLPNATWSTGKVAQDVKRFLNTIDGPLSRWECKIGQLEPDRCLSCHRSRSDWCYLAKPHAMLSRRRNALGVLLPVKQDEQLDPVGLKWSAFHEIVGRLRARNTVKICSVCSGPIVDGMPYWTTRVHRARQTRKANGVMYHNPVEHWYQCSPECHRRIYSSGSHIYRCRRCRRTAIMDTVSMETTQLCPRCLKEYILLYGLTSEDTRIRALDAPRSIWSFATRSITPGEAMAAGFKYTPTGSETILRDRVYIPTWDGLYWRQLGHAEQRRYLHSFEQFRHRK